MNGLIIIVCRGYQRYVSPLLVPRCRFYPTCSQYWIECFSTFPFFRALWYSSLRLLKCHPLHPGGVDKINGKVKDG